MSGGRPRTAIGTYGEIRVRPRGRRSIAETRYRDLDGRLRKVSATADSPATARALLKQRLVNRTGYGSGGQLSPVSPFGGGAHGGRMARLSILALATSHRRAW